MVSRDGNLSHGITGVSQTNVHGLALSGSFALVKGGQAADGGVERGDTVDDGNARPDGGHAVIPGEHGDSGHGLADRVVANLIAVGAELTIGGDVHHDDTGVDLLELFVAKAHLLDGSRPEVLD